MKRQLLISIRMAAILLLMVSGVYPAIVWAVGQATFRSQVNGSLLHDLHGAVVGSALLGQGFTKSEYFHPRPSAAGSGYDPTMSGGTNLGPTSDKLLNGVHKPDIARGKPDPSDFDGVRDLAVKYRAENRLAPDALVPVDAVTRSASGLDIAISPANADLQIARVALARRSDVTVVRRLVKLNTQARSLGVFGEPTVNVLQLNIALDKSMPVSIPFRQ